MLRPTIERSPVPDSEGPFEKEKKSWDLREISLQACLR
jgi:hypothetical protein